MLLLNFFNDPFHCTPPYGGWRLMRTALHNVMYTVMISLIPRLSRLYSIRTKKKVTKNEKMHDTLKVGELTLLFVQVQSSYSSTICMSS